MVFRRSSVVEQLTVNQLVVGSTPTVGANIRRFRVISSVGRAPPLHGGCQEFESLISHQLTET